MLVVSVFLVVPAVSQALTLNQRVAICDSFYSSDNAPSGQESGTALQDMMIDRLVGCLNTYEEAGTPEKFDYVIAMHDAKLSQFKSNLQQATYANIEGLDNQRGTVRYAEMLYSEVLDEFGNLKVRDINGFKGAVADLNGLGKFVGRANYPGSTGCNASYVEYPNGVRGIVTNAHCFMSGGTFKGDLNLLDVEFGIQMGNSRNQKLKVVGMECGTNYPDSNVGRDECLLLTDRLPSGIEPAERVFLTMNELEDMRQRGEKIGLIGTHPSRTGETIKGANGEGPYYADTTRTIQSCFLESNPYGSRGKSNFIFYKCDTLNASSGAAVTRWNAKKQRMQYIGTHKGADDKQSSSPNFAINTQYHELNFKFP